MKPTLKIINGLVAVVLSAGCGIDPQIWGNLTESEFDEPPPAGSQTLAGAVSELGAGAQVAFYAPGGVVFADQGATTTEGGQFATLFPATATYVNTIVVAQAGDRSAWGIAPRIPAKKKVTDQGLTVTLGTDAPDDEGQTAAVPLMADLDADATTATLMLLAKVGLAEPASNLGAVSGDAVVDALTEIEVLFGSNNSRVQPLRDMVTRLVSGDLTTKVALRPFPAQGESYLDLSALTAGADYTGDDVPDTTTTAFDEALANAIGTFEFNVCYADDRIRVVLVTDFRQGGKDRNCDAIDRFKWTIDAPDKHMFITGALHETTPNCDTDEPPCIDSETFDAAGQLMGNWTPNTIPMYDDGTHGDAVAGDNRWTITFDLPWFDAGSPTARWVRIGYKYTWGSQGALWGGSEEWPGNQRILELRDLNGDRMIVREDVYADETTNKDKSNLLAPGAGGCGSVLWQSELNPPPEGRRENCIDDTLEAMIDTDGDCELDAWPSVYSASPITIDCEE